MIKQDQLLQRVKDIKEVTFKISSNRRLFDKLFGRKYYEVQNGKFAYVAYTDKDGLIRGWQINRNSRPVPSFKRELADFIKLYNPKDPADYIFFNAAAPFDFEELRIRDIFKKKYKKCEIVDFILKDSKGLLLWPYQFRHLLQFLWYRGWADVKKEIKDYLANFSSTGDVYQDLMNVIYSEKKDKYIENLMKELKFTKTYSMHNVLKERRARRLLFNPHMERAYNLCKAMGQK